MLNSIAQWSWWRKAILLAAVIVVVLGGWTIGRRWYRDGLAAAEIEALRERGQPTNAIELNEYVALRPGEPDATGAWLVPMGNWRSAAGASPTVLDIVVSEPPLPGESWPKLAEAKAFVAKHESDYSDIDAALVTPGRCVYVRDYRPPSISLPSIGGLRYIWRMLAVRAIVETHGDRQSAALSNLQGMFATTETMKDEPLLVFQLIRLQMVHHSLLYLEVLLPALSAEDASLRQLQDELAGVDMLDSLRVSLIGNRAVTLKAFDQSLSDSLRGAWHGDDQLSVIRATAEVEPLLSQDWPGPLELADKYPQEMDFREAGSLSPWGANDVAPSLGPAMIASRVVRIAKTTARVRAAVVAIAAVRYHLQHNAWPESIDQLVPAQLETVPLDPFTGEPLKLLKTDSELRIYSVGFDRQDDAGEEITGPDWEGENCRTGEPDVVFRLRLG